MGQTLSEPSQDKRTDSGSSDKYAYAVSEMQGWRISMEDAHATILELDDREHNSFFAVYDGHGGSSVAKYSGQHVHTRLALDKAYASKDYRGAFKNAFLGTDDDLRTDPAFYHDPSGCTAVAVLLTSDGQILCANAGDSRAVLSLNGEVKPLSYDHKPQNYSETARITAAGGYVEYNRVNGNLALSRAIGDFEFKQNFSLPPEKQIVTADPDVITHTLSTTLDEEFLVIACDGIWDCMSSQDVVNWVRWKISERTPLGIICEELMARCLSPDSDVAGGIGCDNMTVMVIALLGTGKDGQPQLTLDEWYDRIAARMEKGEGHPTPTSYYSLYPPPRIGLGSGSGGIGGGIYNSSGYASQGADGPGGFLSPSWLQRLNRPLYLGGNTGGIGGGIASLLPGSSLDGDRRYDDSDEDRFEDDSDEEHDGRAHHSGPLISPATSASSFTQAPTAEGMQAPPPRDETSSLRAQLEALDKHDQESAKHGASSGDVMDVDVEEAESEDGDNTPYNPLRPRKPMSIGSPLVPSPKPLEDLHHGYGHVLTALGSASGGDASQRPKSPGGGPSQGEVPPSPAAATHPVGENPIEQVRARNQDDAPSNTVRAEGLKDSSESPTKM